MNITVAIDGVTPVNAELLNSYRAGIEACEQALPDSKMQAALGGRPGEDPPGGYNPFVCMRDRRVFEDAVRFRDDFIGGRADAWQVTVTGSGTCTQTSMPGGVVILETSPSPQDRVVLSFGGARFLEWGQQSRPYVRCRFDLRDVSAEASVGLYADDDNLIEINHGGGGGAGQTWQARCRADGVQTSVNTGVEVQPAPLWLTLVENDGGVDFYLDYDGGLPHERAPEASISDNIPSLTLEPRVRVETTTESTAALELDLFHVQANGR